jgi:hypothetical protein
MPEIKKPIYDKETKKYVSIAISLTNGIRDKPDRFIIPKNRVIVPDGRTYKLITPYQATLLIRKNKLDIKRIIGNFKRTREEKINLKEAKIGVRKRRVIEALENNDNFVRHVMTPTEKLDPWFLYKFFKDNDVIVGNGKLVFAQDGIVIFEEDLNIYRKPTNREGVQRQSIVNWWKKNNGFYIGMIDSNTHAWTAITSRQGDMNYYYSLVKGETYGDDKYKLKNIFNERKITERQKQIINNQLRRTKTIMYWIPNQNINALDVYQIFRENETNTCFFDGVEQYCLRKDTIYTRALLNKLDAYKNHYPDGVNEKDLQQLCNELKINVNINDVFNNNSIKLKSKTISKIGTVSFVNTYLNHLDVNEFVDNNNSITEINTYSEMRNIIKDCIKNNQYFYYKGSANEPSKIFTKKTTYKYKNVMNEIINDFNNDININDYSIDIKKYDKLYDFIMNGVNYNAHTQFKKLYTLDYLEIEKSEKYIEYDMKRAYSQYKNCKYYMGFPNIMTPEIQLENWTVQKCKKYVGYYKIYLRYIQDENKRAIMEEMGFENNKFYVLTSPEIEFFSTFCDFDIISGSYSFKPLDIQMTDEMIKKIKVEKYRRKDIFMKPYALWTGKLNATYENTVMKTHLSEDMAEVLKNKYDNVMINDIRKFKNDFSNDEVYNNDEIVECIVSKTNEKVYWLGHIGGFVTAYTRINVLEQLLKFKHNQIIGFKLDGFIIEKSKDDDEINKQLNSEIWYQVGEKPTVCNFGWGINIYEDIYSSVFFKPKNIYHTDLFKNRVSYLTGAGGTGKSHTVLNNLNDTIYLTACWSLCVSKSKEYDIKSMSIHKFIGIGCESYLQRNKPPNRILIDEITMIDKKYIKQVIKECPYSQIFIAGDVDTSGYYQCAFEGVNVIKPEPKKTIHFTTNYRCKDDNLLQKLNNLRKYMKMTDFNNYRIKSFVKKEFQDRIIDKKVLTDTYDYKKDWVLVSITNGENSQTEYYTKLLNGNKYRCVKHTTDDVYKRLEGKTAFLTGEIVYDLDNPNKRFEKQDAFTIHGFQGKTIKDPDRLFIDLNNIFCSRQLYTALSRVENLNQIYLIE